MNASPGSFYLTRPDVLLRLEGLAELVVQRSTVLGGCLLLLYPCQVRFEL
jgi:hypothetical protein